MAGANVVGSTPIYTWEYWTLNASSGTWIHGVDITTGTPTSAVVYPAGLSIGLSSNCGGACIATEITKGGTIVGVLPGQWLHAEFSETVVLPATASVWSNYNGAKLTMTVINLNPEIIPE